MMSRIGMFAVILASTLFTGLMHAEAPLSDEQARTLAAEVVAKATGASKVNLNTKRMEDLEDDLFSAQVKVRGQIHKGAYFYRVEDGGYVITPDEATYRPHSAESWYVAVSTADGESFGLYGFKDADAGFRRLISKIPIQVLNSSEAQAFARFYLESVYQAQARVVYDELQLKHNVEEHFVGFAGTQEPTATKEHRFRQWWNAFKAEKVGLLEPSAKNEDSNRYRVVMKVLEMTVGRPPELFEWSFEIQKNGAAVANKHRIFPANPRSS